VRQARFAIHVVVQGSTFGYIVFLCNTEESIGAKRG